MGANSSFYNQGGASYPDATPPGPDDAPLPPTYNKTTATSFYVTSGYVSPSTYVPTYFILGF